MNMVSRYVLLILGATMLCLSNPVVARGDYEDEIIEHVIDPCYLSIVNEPGGLAEMIGTKDALTLTKSASEDTIRDVIKHLLPFITGKSFKERKVWYDFSLKQCKSGAGIN